MTTDQQIEAARKALSELTADEAELSRLETEQAAEIASLKLVGSRDFARLAALEGKRAALASMLTEQRTSINQARARVSNLEAERTRAEAVAALRVQVAGLTARRVSVDALLTEMADTLAAQLAQINAERMAWHEELGAARSGVGALFGLPPMGSIDYGGGVRNSQAREGWSAAFEELGEGAELALTAAASGRPIGGALSRPYDVPEAARRLQSTAETARFPLSRYFDRPVSLTLAGVLFEADRATPHMLRSQEF